MAISENHKWRYIFHFTDMENLDSIIKNGLLCTNEKDKRGIKHKNIANMNIQERRAAMDVPVGPGGKVHDYVPFYFSSINPMLLRKLNEKNVDQQLIIYLCVKIQRLEEDDAVFTDSSANTADSPNFYNDTNHLDKLDWGAIDKKSWGVASDEERHKKMAEAFIHNRIEIEDIDTIVVYNEWARKNVLKVFEDNKVSPPPVLYDYNFMKERYSFYYTKFFIESMKNDSLVTGPLTLLEEYKSHLDEIKTKRKQKRNTYPYQTIEFMVDALDKDITVIPELKAIAGLLQDYNPHHDNVDDHTKKVVAEMRKFKYYTNASSERKNILVLASYLHDIGKGPQTKWETGKMTGPYPDHPADAVPMLSRILAEDIETLSDEEIRLICMLVIYHDIVGDCMEKGRNSEQIVNVIENEDDLDMLFAMSYADAKAIKGIWALNLLCREKAFKTEIMKMKKG